MFHHDLNTLLLFVLFFVGRFLWVLSHACVREAYRYLPYLGRPVIKHNLLEAI